MIVSFSWDFYEYNNIQEWLSLVIENAIRKFCTMFTLWSVWLFFFCGQLFVVYHNKIAKELETLVSIHGIQDNVRAKEKIWSLINHHVDGKFLLECGQYSYLSLLYHRKYYLNPLVWYSVGFFRFPGIYLPTMAHLSHGGSNSVIGSYIKLFIFKFQ